jgi:predicted nuclease with TOPRIM domain
MALVQITDDLQKFVEKLSALKDATSVTNPDYQALKRSYTEASDLLERCQEKEIDDSGGEYREFAAKIKEAMVIFDEAEKKIAKISKVVKIVAQVLEVAAKVVAKIC